MNTNPGPDDARRPGRSFSDAAAMFQPIIPVTGTPRPDYAPAEPVLDDELPPAVGPQPIPDAPRVPQVLERAEPVAFMPAPFAPARPVSPAPEFPVEPPFAEVAEPEPVHQAAAPLPAPRARRRWWPMLVLPVILAAVATLAWLQPTPWQTQIRGAIQTAVGDTPAVTPGDPTATVAAANPSPAVVPPAPSVPAPTAPAAIRPAPLSPAPATAAPSSANPSPTDAAPPTAPAPAAVDQQPAFPWVAIRIRANSPGLRAEAERIAGLLGTSAARLDIRAVQTGLRVSTIRYFRPEDAAGAQALALAIPRAGASWRVQAARPPRNPAPGRFEVWLSEP